VYSQFFGSAYLAGTSVPLKNQKPLIPGTIVLPRLGVPVELEADGQPLRSYVGITGEPRYEVPSGYPVTVKFIVPGAESKVPDMTVSLDEGETIMLDLPAGRFTLPWLPRIRACISLDKHLSESLKSFRSPLLPVGTYQSQLRESIPSTVG